MRLLDPRLLHRARAARVVLGLDVVLGVGMAVLVLVQATLIAHVVARAFAGAAPAGQTTALVLLVAVFAARGALTWGFEVLGRRGASTVLSELRLALVARRLRQSPAALDGVEGAEVAAAAVQGVDGLEAYFGGYLPQAVLACLVPPMVIVYVGTIDLESALLMLATLPLVPVFMWLIGRHTEERTRARWLSLRLLSTHFLDVVRGLPTLRAFNRSQAQADRLGEVGEEYRRATMATLRLSFLSGAVLELASTLGVALVAVTIGVRLDRGGIGLQAGLVALLLAPELYLPLRQLGARYHASADGLAVADRMLRLLEQPAETGAGGSLFPPSPATAVVRLEGVSFSYPSRAALVIDGLDLELWPGEIVALAGESGAGKSTVASLLLRLAEPASGHVTAAGVDLAGCSTEAWRRLVAWVPQRPTMFHGTVAAQIRLGDPAATDEQVRRAAWEAGADEFVRALPEGYDTVVGDGGRPLSAGEVRRLGLARALVRDAPLLVLDEPTADLDPASARLVGDAIARLRGTRTVLLIAHRPDLAALADRVIVLAGGRAVAPAESEAAA
jgi:thiol reductant ABC exporter CydD subunit